MLNINELEAKWKRYKIKSFIPHVVIFFSTLIIVTLSFTFFSPNKKPSSEMIEIKPTIALQQAEAVAEKVTDTTQKTKLMNEEKEEIKEKSVTVDTIQIPKNSSIETKQKKITLTPSLDFMKSINRDALPYYTQTDGDEKVLEQELKNTTTHEQQVKETPKVEIKEESINIKKGTTQDDIQHVLKRFKKNNNPALSLFVAQKYYDLGDYHNSYNYALITNEINNNIEESWIIFTKSLVKLGQKEMAIKTLKQYLEYSNSSKANRLLEEILSGKFQ